METTGIFFIVEAGPLEEQAKILVYSLRKWGKIEQNIPLFAYKPRKGKRISPETLAFFKQHEVEFIELPLNQQLDFYPLANKPYAATHFLTHYGHQFEQLLFLDTDLLICQPLSSMSLPQGTSIGVRTWIQDHFKGLPHQATRKQMFQRHFPQVPSVPMPLVDGNTIQAHYNTGVILVKSDNDFFHRWQEMLLQVLGDSRIRLMKGLNFYFLEESVFAYLALELFQSHGVYHLDFHDNAPIETHLRQTTQVRTDKIRILHYHNIQDLWNFADHAPYIEERVTAIRNQIDLGKKRPSWRRPYEILRFQRHKHLKLKDKA